MGVLGAAAAIAWELMSPPTGRMAAAFSGEIPETWPPPAPASLEAELANTEAMRRLGAAGLAPDGYRPDAGPDGGPPGDVPGLLVRTGTAEGLYYIEAVFGADARFDDPLPMALLIHGRGDRARIPGGPFWGLGAPLRVIVPQAPDPLGDGYEWLPVRVGSGLIDRLTTSLMSRAAHVARFLRTLREQLPTVGRPLVSGFSQGGLLTFTLAIHHSDVVEAAFPLSAWLPPALMPTYRRDDVTFPRIRSMHGSADRIILPEPTLEAFRTLEGLGFDAEIVTFEGVGHEVTPEMDARLHEWLQEALGVLVERAVADGIYDGGLPPPCYPADGALPLEAGVLEAGVPDGGWPCPDGAVARDLDGGVPAVDGGR